MCLYLQRKTKKRDMKTNQLMKRPMGQFEVLQRTSDSYFDANALVSQWNNIKGNPRRKISEYLKSPKTIEFINAIENDLSQCREYDNADFKAVKEVKGRNTKNGRTKDQLWVHPFLFIDLCMWINPSFKLQVVKFVYDELIKNRHLAGDNYNILTAAIAKLPNTDYKEVAKAIQWIVFNMTGKNLRQSATQEQLKEISEIEHSLAFSIDMGLVKDYFSLMNLLREMYNKKYRKF